MDYPKEPMFPKLASINALLFSLTALSDPLNRRQVGPNSKAGLAWPNGPYDNIQQYTTTGKVSWCVHAPRHFVEPGPSTDELQKVLYLEPKFH